MTWTQMRELLHKEDQERARAQVEQAIREGSDYDIEYRVIHPKAMERWVAAKGRAQYNASGQVVGMLGVVQDVTEYKRTQQALRQSEERLRLFIQQISVCVAMLDQNMCYITASQQWIDTYKLGSMEAVLGRSHYEIFPNLPQRWKQVHQSCLAGATEKQDEDCFLLPDGSQQWLRWKVHPWYDSRGKVGGILIFSEDITAAKQAQQELQQSLQTLSTLIKAAPLPIVAIEPNTRVQLWNPAAEQLFGWSETEVLGQLLPIIPEEKLEECRQLREAVANGEVFFGVETYRRKRDGAKVIDTRDYLSFVLKLAGATVTVAASAGKALQALARSQPDVLLSDIGMPDMDGYMLLQQVRSLPLEHLGQIPAIALTAYAGEFDRQQAIAAGFQMHLAKPIEPEKLIGAIVNLLNENRANKL